MSSYAARRDYLAAYRTAYRQRPEVRKMLRAESLLGGAVRRGEIVKRPCFNCGCRAAEAHHENYDLPYSVVWACKACHKQVHHHRTLGLSQAINRARREQVAEAAAAAAKAATRPENWFGRKSREPIHEKNRRAKARREAERAGTS